jgi:hypothetical protein
VPLAAHERISIFVVPTTSGKKYSPGYIQAELAVCIHKKLRKEQKQ